MTSAGKAGSPSAWQRIRGTFAWLRGLVVVSREMPLVSARVVIAYLHATAREGRLSRGAAGGYSSVTTHVKPLGRLHRVWLQVMHATPRFYWVHGRPLWFTSKIQAPSQAGFFGEASGVFSFLRGTVAWDDLLLAASDWESGVESRGRASRFLVVRHHGARFDSNIYGGDRPSAPPIDAVSEDWHSPAVGNRIIGWTHADVACGAPATALDALSLRPELEAVVREIRDWYGLREWCAERAVPWRRSFAFHGPPGTGKSSLVRAIAEDLGIPVHVFDLASMSNADLDERWSRMLAHAPCVALIEDIDGVFCGRTNVAPSQGALGGGGLTFDGLLNCIQGVERADGVLFVITTNDLSKVDPALCGVDTEGAGDIPTRPGRIDRIVRFEPLDHAGRLKLALRILDGDHRQAGVLAALGAAASAAQFQERCYRQAMAGRVRLTKEAS